MSRKGYHAVTLTDSRITKKPANQKSANGKGEFDIDFIDHPDLEKINKIDKKNSKYSKPSYSIELGKFWRQNPNWKQDPKRGTINQRGQGCPVRIKKSVPDILVRSVVLKTKLVVSGNKIRAGNKIQNVGPSISVVSGNKIRTI